MTQKSSFALTRRLFAVTLLAAASAQAVHAQSDARAAVVRSTATMSSAVAAQIDQVQQTLEARSAVQQKLSSNLYFAAQYQRGQALAGLDDMYASALDGAPIDASGSVSVDISATVTDRLLKLITANGGQLGYFSPADNTIRATLPVGALEAIAASPNVRHIAQADRMFNNVGSVTTQGYITHKANLAVNAGYDGTGVKVGVLSDSATATRVAALIASGDLGADTTVLSAGTGTDEGTAMMEIIHDLAPGAKLYFATANSTQATFAANIRALRAAGCDIIVDDVGYFAEGVFQDGTVAQAVNDVTDSGALYFSAAANSGSLTNGTSGTWEGDFVSGGAGAAPLPTTVTLHAFAPGQNYNVLTVAANYVYLKWADKLGASTNDYDMYVLNSTGTTILCTSATTQSGASDPVESCTKTTGSPANYPIGSRIVIAKKAAAATVALHLDTNRAGLTIPTTGATYGHGAAAKAVGVAAVYWNASRNGTKPFVGGAAVPTETFSSDGPRQIFFTPTGTAITAGAFTFASGGGTQLAKPDIAAADGAVSKTPTFSPFFGTSAAAPHAAAIAALVKSARPDYTNAQILNAMKATALDIRAAGVDRDSGSGLVMAWEAVQYALTH